MSAADRMQGLTQLALAGVVVLVVVTIIALFGIALVGGMTEGMEEDPETKLTHPDPVTGEYVSFQDTGPVSGDVLKVYNVSDSRGYAVELTGAPDSYVQSNQDVQIASDDTWTACTWASVDTEGDAVNKTMTALSIDGRVLIQYNGTSDNWTAYYYQDGSTNSYRVTVSAPNQPGNLTLLCAQHNGTAFSLSRNATADRASVSTTGSNIADATIGTKNWDGRLDETRTFDIALNDSVRTEHYNNPVGPLPGTNRTARIYYDEGSGKTVNIFIAGATATLNNGSWVDGLNGHELVEGTDYEIRVNRGGIKALSGGKIDGAPAVWVRFQFQPGVGLGGMGADFSNAFSLLASGIIVIPAVVVLAMLIGGLMIAVQMRESDLDPFNFGPGNR